MTGVVERWTGRHAALLRQSLRLTNERMAERLGTAVRTVAKWNAQPDIVPTPEMQRALDTLLAQSSDDVKERFVRLLVGGGVVDAAPAQVAPADTDQRLTEDRNLASAFDWLDQAAGWASGTARSRVGDRLRETNPRAAQDLGRRRGRVQQRELAEALRSYYGPPDDHWLYSVRTETGTIMTSVLTKPDWLDLALPLDADRDGLRFVPSPPHLPQLDALAADAAVQRIADAIMLNLTIVNTPIYRLTDVAVSSTDIRGTVSLTDFTGYALTTDLLENETIDALVTGRPMAPGRLPLRDRYLPDLAAVCDLRKRQCVGGPLALTAIARPGDRRRRGGDYLLLVQERAGKVLNSARRLAVIPKAFHQSLVDYADDAAIGATLERELEEELFGRTDIDSTIGEQRRADPMHSSRLSEPMRWLMDHVDGGHWRMECTGFGLNLVSGNYEFASLIVVEDEEWWARFGGSIAANWESTALRRYSSRDRMLLDALAHDPAWSNEGLFALLQGLRRLAEIGGDRAHLPAVEWEL